MSTYVYTHTYKVGENNTNTVRVIIGEKHLEILEAAKAGNLEWCEPMGMRGKMYYRDDKKKLHRLTVEKVMPLLEKYDQDYTGWKLRLNAQGEGVLQSFKDQIAREAELPEVEAHPLDARLVEVRVGNDVLKRTTRLENYEVRQIREMAAAGSKVKDIAEIFKKSPALIRNIIKGNLYKNVK